MNIAFAGAEVAALDGVIKQPVDAVAIVAIIFRGVDAALRRYGMGAARAVLKAETFDVIAKLCKRRRRRGARQARTDNQNIKLAFIGRVDEFLILFVLRPLLRQRPGRN